MIDFTHKILSFLLIVQLIFPSSILATNELPLDTPIPQAEVVSKDQSRNLFKLLTQTLRSKKNPDKIWDLSSSNISKPEVFTSIVEFRNLKQVSFYRSRLDIIYEKTSYVHSIDMEVPIKDVIVDDDFILILTEDNLLHAIDVFFLAHVVFSAPCPVFTVLSLEDLNPSTLSLIKRRFTPLDQRISVEQLSLSSRKNSKILDETTPVDIELLKSEFKSIKYTPLAAEILELTPFLHSGDLAIIENDQITHIIPRSLIISEVNRRLILYSKFQSLALEPSFKKALSSIHEISLEEISSLFPAYLEASTIQEESSDMNQILDHSNSFVALSEFTDIFTPKEWEDDSVFFTTFLNSVENKMVSSGNTVPKSKFRYIISKALKENLLPEHVIKFASLLKNKFTLGSLIFIISGLSYIRFFPDSPLSNYSVEQFSIFLDHTKSLLFEIFPVTKDYSYMKLLSYSMFCQLILMYSIYFVARIVAPFTQFKSDTLPPLVGSKIFKNIFMVSPFRLFALFTGNLPIFTGLKKGVVPDSFSFKPDSDSRNKNFISFRHKVEFVKIKNFFINSFLTNSLILIHKFKFKSSDNDPISEELLLEDLSDPAIKQIIKELYRMLTDTLDQFDFKDPDLFISATKEASDILEKFYTKLDQVEGTGLPDDQDVILENTSSKQDNYNPRSFNSQSQLTSTLIKLIFNYNEKIYKTISQVAPNNFTSSITKRQFFTNYILSMIGQALIGNFADPTTPEHLMAQRNSAFFTSSKVNTFNFQKIIGHIGKGPIATNLIFKEEAKRINREYYPAEFMDIVEHDMNFRSYPFLYEFVQYGKNIFNIRGAEPGKLLVRWLTKSYIVLFQATMIIGCIFRIYVGHQPVREAVLGILLFSAASSFICNWPWTLLSAAQYIQDNNIKADYKQFVLEFIKLKQSTRLASTEDIKALCEYFYNKYTTTHMRIPKDVKQSIKECITNILESTDTDTIVNEASTLTKLIQKVPAVPKATSEVVSFIYTAIASVSSAFLLSFLITKSFDSGMHLWGISKSIFDINFFTHIPDDGVIPLLIKSAVLTTLVYSAQDLFNLSYDYIKYLLTPKLSPKKEQLKAKLALTQQEFKRTPVLKILRCVTFFSKKD